MQAISAVAAMWSSCDRPTSLQSIPHIEVRRALFSLSCHIGQLQIRILLSWLYSYALAVTRREIAHNATCTLSQHLASSHETNALTARPSAELLCAKCVLVLVCHKQYFFCLACESTSPWRL